MLRPPKKGPSVPAAGPAAPAAGPVVDHPTGARRAPLPRGPHRRHPQPGWSHRQVIIVGVGNDFRSDDAAGLVVARALRTGVPKNVAVVELDGEATSLLDVWDGCDLAIVVDAVKGNKPPGHLYRFDALVDPPPKELFRYSTHTFGVSAAIELGRALDRLPDRLIVYGIEGDNFGAGEGLTPDVEQTVAEAAAMILHEVAE
jgi:hydrogenase maturation protease